MVVAGVATKLDAYRYFNANNQIVDPEDAALTGITLSNVFVTDPSYILFVDETGSSTNMRKDKPGCKKVIAEKGYAGTQQATSSNICYTTMGFTATTGEPVMCVIIFTSESTKGIPTNWLTGIGITKIDNTFEIPDDREGLVDNIGKIACGGPKCTFRNINVPCLVQYSLHGGITPGILTNCFKRMDELDLFPRESNKKPFVLLHGHDSRFNLEFLRYIRDDNHPWSVIIGLPYGTHLWQVGDSHAQNGNYKHYEQAFKDILLKEKLIWNMPLTLKPTDVVPIVNYTWERSFAVKRNNQKAILDRGWCPANRALEVHPDVLLRTKKASADCNLTVLKETNTTESTTTFQRGCINPTNGTAAFFLESTINSQSNDPATIRKRRERKKLADITKMAEEATRKLT